MIDQQDLQLLLLTQQGLPFCPRPYAKIGQQINMPEQEVIARLSALKQQGLIKRLGVIVKHNKLGYKANAMVVWDIPDQQIKQYGRKISQVDFVTLCYQRPRNGQDWPYNLFCMIHGKDKQTVLQQLESLIKACDLKQFKYAILFSRQCFKQRGAFYQNPQLSSAHG